MQYNALHQGSWLLHISIIKVWPPLLMWLSFNLLSWIYVSSQHGTLNLPVIKYKKFECYNYGLKDAWFGDEAHATFSMRSSAPFLIVERWYWWRQLCSCLFVLNGLRKCLLLYQTCMNLVDDAFNACSTGIRKAQDQCLSVMRALGTVYHHARDVLDRINPDRWSSKQQQQQQQQHHQQQIQKRQVLFKDGRCDLEIDRYVIATCFLSCRSEISLLSTHADRQGVDISFTVFVLFFVFFCLYGYWFLRQR